MKCLSRVFRRIDNKHLEQSKVLPGEKNGVELQTAQMVNCTRGLSDKDVCYKFFFKSPRSKAGMGSICYKKGEIYRDSKLFFFRVDEVKISIDNLLYLMNLGDTIAKIKVTPRLIESAIEADRKFWAADELVIEDVLDSDSEEFKRFIIECLREAKDFRVMYLADVITKMVEYGSFDAAQEILNIICEERKVALEDIQLRQIIELGSQPWRKYISCEELQVCKDMSSFVKLMKQVCCVENDL